MNLGPEMLFLLVLAFLLFGPKRLPEIGRKLGRGLAEFKRASNELKGQLENEMRQLEAEEREKKIAPPAPPPPENTIAAAALSVPAAPDPQLALPMAGPPQAVAVAAPADDPPSPGPGVEVV
jgi:TatA/E family protein of Tat protein translocase